MPKRSSRWSWRMIGTAAAASAALIVTGCAPSAGGDDAPAEKVTIVYSSYVAEGATDSAEGRWWMDRVKELTEGAVDFEVHYSGSLVTGPETLGAVADRRADAGLQTAFYTPAELPLSQIASVPLVTDNAQAVAKALRTLFKDNDAFRAEFLGQGVRPLFFYTIMGAAIGTKEPVESISDLEGLSIRAGGLQTHAVKAAGAEPVAMDFGEVYESTERGVIDGWTTVQFTGGFASGLAEVSPYFTNAGLGTFAATSFLINEDFYQSLPESVRAAMDQASEELSDVAAQMLMENSEQICDDFLAGGGIATTWSEDAVGEWKDVVGDSALDAFKTAAVSSGAEESVVDDFRDAFFSAVEEAEGTSTYVDPLTACSER